MTENNNCDDGILRQPACAQVVGKLWVVHFCVAAFTQVWVVCPEFLVALVQQIDLESANLVILSLHIGRGIPQDSVALDRHPC